MYVFIGFVGIKHSENRHVVVDPKSKTDSDAVASALFWGNDLVELDRIQIWDVTTSKLICALDMCR